MTVGDLIEYLHTLPHHYRVMIQDDDGDMVEITNHDITNCDKFGRKEIYIER